MTVWKDIKGYEGRYQVSNRGEVQTLLRRVPHGDHHYTRQSRLLKFTQTSRGYYRVGLHKNGTIKQFFVHCLVIEAFLSPKPKGAEVNHKDENPKNNDISNLEWVTHLDNMRYGTRLERTVQKRKRPIVQKTLSGEIIDIWPSAIEVERSVGYSSSDICNVCRGKNKTSHGFLWEYALKGGE